MGYMGYVICVMGYGLHGLHGLGFKGFLFSCLVFSWVVWDDDGTVSGPFH